MKNTNPINRRQLIKLSAAGLLPAILPATVFSAQDIVDEERFKPSSNGTVRFLGDGEMFEPADYVATLSQLSLTENFGKDSYGNGGAVTALEQQMASITGKEKAIFMPTGTMANQLAMAVLSGNKAKIFVQDLSHIYRDEADAAQTVFQKRLMPLGSNKSAFDQQELEQAIKNLPRQEVFDSGIGAVAIECPVRRAEGQYVPIETIRAIRNYCVGKGIPMHLDGARLFIASAWSGVSIKDYANEFDTVYISLYKYFGAAAGAVLCGPANIIDQMPHLIKVHGGTMYGNWANAAMALHRMEKFDERIMAAKNKWQTIVEALVQIPGVIFTTPKYGTNICFMQLPNGADGKKMQRILSSLYQIQVLSPDANNRLMLFINETIAYQSTDQIVSAFRNSLK